MVKLLVILFLFTVFAGRIWAKEPQIAVIVAFPSSEKKLKTIKQAGEEEGIQVKTLYVGRLSGSIPELMRHMGNFTLPEADIYLFDIPPEEVRRLLKPYLEKMLKGKEFYVLNEPSFGTSPELSKRLYEYYESGGKRNFRNLFRVLLGRPAEEPVKYPKAGFYSPRYGVMETLSEELKRRIKVVVLFHRADLEGENTKILDRLLEAFESRGTEAIGFYYPELEGLSPYLDRLLENGKPLPRAIVNLRLMYFKPDAEREGFQRLGLPVFGGIIYRGKLSDWEKSPSGLPVVLLPFYFILPEYLGVVDPTLLGYEEGEKRPIERLVENFVGRVTRWIALIEKENRDKRLAIVYYNYPPGEGNILAANLNVVRSLVGLLREAEKRGYLTETPVEEELRAKMLEALGYYYGKEAKSLLSCLPLKEYLAWYRNIPEEVRREIEQAWGPPQSEPFLKGECFPIPEVRLGNISLLPLAPRGFNYAQTREIYHSTKVPPSHYYLAFYLYLQRNFDALIHFGTHGTQEWTPGKERALDVWDFPYLTLGEIPVIYPYIVDNIGEAVQAKRRGRALIISHQTPAFAPSGTYGVLEELHQLLHKEGESEGRLKQKLREEIANLAIKERIAFDLGYRDKESILKNFEEFNRRLHDYIHEVASQNVPLGLHTFGETKQEELIKLTILQMLGKEWIKTWEDRSPEEFFARPLEEIKGSQAFAKIGECLAGKEVAPHCNQIRDWYSRFSADSETEAFFSALDGRYIETSYGGDPIKNPDSLPTGRNLYGFDPTRVPPEVAWKTAVELTDEWLKDYYSRKGEYPRKVAFSLWSTETMRHRGVVEAQILYLLGVKPKWDQWGRVSGLEIIPREVLGRPRIDVAISATGLYRDHFPNLMNLINQAIRTVSELKEEDNFVAQNTEKILNSLRERGFSEERAKKYATIRIFSNEAGTYGTGLDEAVYRTRDRKALTELYLSRMSFAYDEDLHGEKIQGLYEENLKDVEAVLLSRSSNLYGMLTTDDPFQYLGGLAMAVEVLSGKRPEVLIANLRSSGKIQEAGEFLLREVRSRYLNPEYLKAMMKEGATGVSQVLDVLNNLYGWNIVSPQVVRDYLWQEFKEVLLEDKYRLGMREWFKTNPQAYREIVERLIEGIALHSPGTAGQYGLSARAGFRASVELQLNPENLLIRGQIMKPVHRDFTAREANFTPRTELNILFVFLLILIYTLGFVFSMKKRVFV